MQPRLAPAVPCGVPADESLHPSFGAGYERRTGKFLGTTRIGL